jgi:outer membrane protein TolC
VIKSPKRLHWWSATSLAGCALLAGLWIPCAPAQDKSNPEAAPPAHEALAPAKADSPGTPPFSADEIFKPGTEVMQIDLLTALRLADAGNPTIALARQRVEEAYARVRQAQLLWLPDLQLTPAYLRHDGEIQNSTGVVFNTNKSAVYGTGGAVLSVDSGDVLFAPLIARRLAEAQAANSRTVNNNVQLDVALAYQDLLHAYGLLAVNTNLLGRDRELFRRTEEVTKAQLAASGADLNRARTAVELRLQERIAIKGQVRVASSRLARLLLLKPTVALVPADPLVVPIALVPETTPADDLIMVGMMTRPELAEGRSLVAASEARLRQARLSPLMPRLEVAYGGGTFGGGQDSFVGTFHARGDGAAGLVWDLKNLGLGNAAINRVQRVQVNEANLHVAEVQAQVADEVNSALQIALARREALDSAQEAVRQAAEMYRKLDELSFGMTGPKKELNTVEPLLALQALAQARVQYLNAVIDYNRAQFRLFTAMGRPSVDALEKATPTPLETPAIPPPYNPLSK